MARLFDEHIIRSTRSLSGTWKMQKDENGIGVYEMEQKVY